MIFNVSGGGGTALNFRVVGGTTAPSNPKENMIWVNTSTKITSYIFSATQPTGSAGMVWISTGTSSSVEFNALKKNGIQVYPISAKQYVSGAWVDKTAKSYQGGKWVEWRIYLYNSGIQNVSWIVKPGTGTNWAVRTTTFENDYVLLSNGSGTNDTSVSGFVTKEKIDISSSSTLFVEFEDMSNVDELCYIQILVTRTQTDNWDHNNTVSYTVVSANTDKATVKLNAPGSYYIDIFAMRAAGAKVKKVYLE